VYDFFLYAWSPASFSQTLFPAGDEVVSTISPTPLRHRFRGAPWAAWCSDIFGDKIGRKSMLVLTLMIMGDRTVLIAWLPDLRAVGIAAPLPAAPAAHSPGIGLAAMGCAVLDGL